MGGTVLGPVSGWSWTEERALVAMKWKDVCHALNRGCSSTIIPIA